MYFSELDVVNDCLSTLGELPVNSLDDDHILIAAARRAFRVAMLREQGRQWWFNTEMVTLVTDVQNQIYTPLDAIRVTTADPELPLVQRGKRLYDTGATGNQAGYEVSVPQVLCRVTKQITFEDLPPSAQLLIGVATQLRFMVAYDADSQRYRQLLLDYQEAYKTLSAEHIRNITPNLLEKSPTFQRLQAIGGKNSNRLLTPR